MKISQSLWTEEGGWANSPSNLADGDAILVIYFTSPGLMEDGRLWRELRARFPLACLLGCTTGGEILGEDVFDRSLVVSAVGFEATRIESACETVAAGESSREVGLRLARALPREGLRSVFVLSDGIGVNGTALVSGLTSELGENVTVTGGLAGDGAAFKITLVGCDAPPEPNRVAAVGFYGDAVQVGHGSFGGWDCFGPKRVVTRSEGNVLYELDGEPALELYRRYLGDEACNLPGSALLFPLVVRAPDDADSDVVRTVIGIDDAANSMTFAGDVPQGSQAQLMRGNFDRLVDGAARAAEATLTTGAGQTRLAILVSCIGRKLLMGPADRRGGRGGGRCARPRSGGGGLLLLWRTFAAPGHGPLRTP